MPQSITPIFVLALAISIGLGIGGQLGLKAGALRDAQGTGILPHPYVVAGLVLYACSALFYVYALRRIPVSVAFPSVSISYVAVAYVASVVWGEPFGWPQVVALIAIGIGVVMLFQYSS